MKNWTIALVAAALLCGVSARAHEGHDDDDMAAKGGVVATMSGELVDMACYLGHGGAGEKHAKCAKMCVMKDGAPLGLLDKSGALYLVVADHANEKPYQAAKELAGEHATLTGRVVHKGGLPALIVSKAQKQ